MGIGIEIPFHEAIVLDLGTACADSFLEQNPARLFLVRGQLADRFPVPLGSACGGGDALFL